MGEYMELPIFYDQAEEWNRAIFLYDSALKEINTKLEILNNEFKLAHQYNPIEHITSRIKSPQSIAKKIRHNGMELTVENIIKYVNDVAGIRIICSFTSDIYRIADLITEQSDVKVLKIKDYIINPKENGYMSYHMIVSIPVFLSDQVIDTKVEIQIRTIAMDFWASLEHKMYYKFEGNAPTHIRRELKECADIVSFLDQKMLALNDEIRTYSVDPLDEYREMMSDMFQTRMKEAYGTIASEGEEVKARAQIPATEPKVIEVDAVIDSEMISAIQEKAKKEEALINNMKNAEKSEKVSFTASLFGRKKSHNTAAN
jgi:putative GTP pyrophosphokinase